MSRYYCEKATHWANYKPEEMMIEEQKRKGNKRIGLWMRDKNVFEREKILTRKV